MEELDKIAILKQCSGIECPYCASELYIGARSLQDQRHAFYCCNCKVRISIDLEIVKDFCIESK